MKTQELSNPQLPPLLRKCWMRLNAIFQKRESRHSSLTPDQYTVLRWLNELPEGTISQSTLKKLMFTDQNNIAGLMGRMEKLDLVERKTDSSDRRRKLIYCTRKGKALFEQAQPIATELEERCCPAFLPKEKVDFSLLDI